MHTDFFSPVAEQQLCKLKPKQIEDLSNTAGVFSEFSLERIGPQKTYPIVNYVLHEHDQPALLCHKNVSDSFDRFDTFFL